MANRSRIEWTDATWNPVTGCSKVSPGCKYCYAERMAKRLAGRCGYPADNPFRVTLHPDRFQEPLRWQKRRRVFVCSMSDLFHEQVDENFIAKVFAIMALTPHHTYQVLTKRPERMAQLLNDDDFQFHVGWFASQAARAFGIKRPEQLPPWPYPHVWIGVTAEDQERAGERIPLLLQTPAAVRFVSCEPLLGPVDLAAAGALGCTCPDTELDDGEVEERCLDTCVFYRHALDKSRRIDWVIVGGESGPGARPMHPDWVRSIRDQCQAAGVPFFFKQWGEWLPNDQEYGANPGDFDYERPHVMVGNVAMCRAGKKRAGRLLDGRTWDEMPRVTQREAV